jgi:hypothetical protein
LLLVPWHQELLSGTDGAFVSLIVMTDRSPEKPKVLSTVKARQGVTGHGVRYVLLYGTAGAMLGFFFAYLVT